MPRKNIQYKDGYRYQLCKPYCVQIDINPEHPIYSDYISLGTDGVLMIRSGYAWDGASGPAIDTKSIMRGALVHDALYQLIRDGLLPESCRETADNILLRLCREDGMSAIRSWYVWKAVRLCGNLANTQRPVLEAP